MKYIAIIAGLALTATSFVLPALADVSTSTDAPVLAKSSAGQHVLVETVSSRIRSALDGEPYALEQTCSGDACSVSESR